MALKLPDSAVPMGDFPVAKAVDIDFDDGENLQEKLDNGTLGGASSEKQIKDWVSGETYEIGDYVYYDGKLYRCTAENSDIDFSGINWKNLSGSEGDITDTIDINSSGTKIPNVKAIYNDVIIGKDIDQTVMDTYGTEILKYPLGIWKISSDDIANKFADLPVKTSGRIEITSIDADTNKNPWNSKWSYRVYNFETYSSTNYFRKVTASSIAGNISTDTGWKELATMDKLGGHSIIKGTTTLTTDQSGAAILTHGGNFDHCTVSIQPTINTSYFFSYCTLDKNRTRIVVANFLGDIIPNKEIEFDWVVIGW